MSNLSRILLPPAGMTIVLGIAGCNLAPDYKAPTPPAQTTTLGEATGQNTSAEVDPLLDQGWEAFFAESRLRSLISLALAHNQDLRLAALKVEQAAASFRITRAASFPGVQGGASASRQRVPADLSTTGDSYHAEQYSLTANLPSYELDLFGKARNRNEVARQTYFATAEAQKGVELALIASVAQQDLAYRNALAQADLARQTLENYESSLNLVRKRFEVGVIPEIDLRSAESQREQARLAATNATEAATHARIALEDLLGCPLPADLPAPAELAGSLLPDLAAGIPADLLRRRPDIRQAENHLHAAYAEIGIARAAFFPSLTLTASGGTASNELEGLFGEGSGQWTINPQLRVPLLAWGANEAGLENAKLAREASLVQYEQTVRTAFREIADALVAHHWGAERVQAAEALVAAQNSRLRLAQSRYDNGVADYLTVLTAQQGLFLARQSLLDTRFDELSRRLNLYRVLGGGWSPNNTEEPTSRTHLAGR